MTTKIRKLLENPNNFDENYFKKNYEPNEKRFGIEFKLLFL